MMISPFRMESSLHRIIVIHYSLIRNSHFTRSLIELLMFPHRQLQGKSWIKNMERENDLVITTLNSKFFRQQLEDSISLGRPLLLEDVDEELDPMLDNILERNYIKLGLSLRVSFDGSDLRLFQSNI